MIPFYQMFHTKKGLWESGIYDKILLITCTHASVYSGSMVKDPQRMSDLANYKGNIFKVDLLWNKSWNMTYLFLQDNDQWLDVQRVFFSTTEIWVESLYTQASNMNSVYTVAVRQIWS